MRKFIWIVISLGINTCWSCTGSVTIDRKKIDEAGNKIQTTVEKGADSLGVQLKRLKNRIDTTKIDTLKF